jgi:hypothetical protein
VGSEGRCGVTQFHYKESHPKKEEEPKKFPRNSREKAPLSAQYDELLMEV